MRLQAARATAILGAAVLLAACGSGPSPSKASGGKQLIPLTVQAGYYWTSSQYYCQYLVGLAKGFFRAEGLNVTFRQGTGSATSAQLIASGKANLGVSIATGALIDAVSAGAPLKMIAATLPYNPIAVSSGSA